jgi:hypothetical protein
MTLGRKVLKLLLAASFFVAGSAAAFMPAGGLWVVDSENNGDSGRGFQLEVENGMLVLTYYGYRANGTSVFYLAAGAISNNTFTTELAEYQNGKALGAPYQAASPVGSVGNVSMTFTSGLHGTITLPGESPMAVSKLAFGYPPGPDGLLGTWQMTYWMSTGYPVTRLYDLSAKVGVQTANGNGVVTDSTRSVSCEFMVSGAQAGTVFCAETGPAANLPDMYNFKFSGDHGDGIGAYYNADDTLGTLYEAHVSRIVDPSGVRTGLNEGSSSSLTTMRAVEGAPASSFATDLIKAKKLAAANGPSPQESQLARAARLWRAEVMAGLK